MSLAEPPAGEPKPRELVSTKTLFKISGGIVGATIIVCVFQAFSPLVFIAAACIYYPSIKRTVKKSGWSAVDEGREEDEAVKELRRTLDGGGQP